MNLNKKLRSILFNSGQKNEKFQPFISKLHSCTFIYNVVYFFFDNLKKIYIVHSNKTKCLI
jgi:hypothetical protein